MKDRGQALAQGRLVRSTLATDHIAQAFGRDPRQARRSLSVLYDKPSALDGPLLQFLRLHLGDASEQTRPLLLIAHRRRSGFEEQRFAQEMGHLSRRILETYHRWLNLTDKRQRLERTLMGLGFRARSPLRELEQVELETLVQGAKERGLQPVILGDPLPKEFVHHGGVVDFTHLIHRLEVANELGTRVQSQLRLFALLRQHYKVVGLIGKNSALLHQLALEGMPTVQIDEGIELDPRFHKFVGKVPGHRSRNTRRKS